MSKEAAQKYLSELQKSNPPHLPWGVATLTPPTARVLTSKQLEEIVAEEVKAQVLVMQKSLEQQLGAALAGLAQMRIHNCDLVTKVAKLEQLILEEDEFFEYNDEDEGVM